MKTSMTKVSVALALMALSGAAMAGIANTKHNLGGSANTGNGGAGWNWTNATTEICVFCHTPHGADNSAAVPIWNRTLGTAGMYTTYSSLGTTTMDASSTGIGSVSLACLSCHDGTQAMDSQLNTPGGGNIGQLVGTTGGANTGANGWVEFQTMSDVSGEPIYLSTDLSNDHPISIQYAGELDNAAGAGQSRLGLDPDFNMAKVATVGNGQEVWYIETGVADNIKQKSDLPLYNRGMTDSLLPGEPLVECATCHDPHTQNTTFLRNALGNAGSATCLTCHVK